MPDIFVLPYSKLDGWQHHLRGLVKAVIFDEAQALRNGRFTNRGAAAAAIAGEADYVVGLTATPVYNYGGELHHLYEVIAPGALGSREEFLREWGGRQWTDVRGRAQATVADPRALSTYLRGAGLMIGRTRADVARELPYGDAVKVPHEIPLDPKVLEEHTSDAIELARFILNRANDSTARWRLSGELDKRLRQATGIAKAPYVAAFAHSLLEAEAAGGKLVIWGWHHAVYDIWTEELERRGHRVARFTGSETTTQKQDAVDAFRSQDPGAPDVLIMSLRAGAGLNGLQDVCRVGIFGELDWSPKIMDQCAGRLARDGQAHEVLTYYLLADEGADPAMAEVLDLKNAQAVPIEDPRAAVVRALPADDRSRVEALARSLLAQKGLQS